MSNKPTLDIRIAHPPATWRAHPCAHEGPELRVFRPLARVLGMLDMQLERPSAKVEDCELRRFAPGSLICESSSLRHQCFIVCRGLVLRRSVERGVRPATAVVGPDEGLSLHGSHIRRHSETLIAITAVELAVIDVSVLRVLEASERLLSRLVGRQGVACIRCWARFGWITDADGAQRVVRALTALAQWLGDESDLLADVWLDADALARWLAMPGPEAESALARLEAQRLVAMRDGILRWINVPALQDQAAGTVSQPGAKLAR